METIITHKGIKNRFKRLYVVFAIIIFLLGISLKTYSETTSDFRKATDENAINRNTLFDYYKEKLQCNEKKMSSLIYQVTLVGKKPKQVDMSSGTNLKKPRQVDMSSGTNLKKPRQVDMSSDADLKKPRQVDM